MKDGSQAKFRLKRPLKSIHQGRDEQQEEVPYAITLIDHASRRVFQSSTQTEIEFLPFQIGRQSRRANQSDKNDYSVVDESPFQVSRVHCSVEYKAGKLLIRDRGSALGTRVNGKSLGKASGVWSAELSEGDNILVLGPEKSPFRFVVRVTANA